MADRDLTHLEVWFQRKVRSFLWDTVIKELGVFVTEGYRSQERQNYLYAQGRTTPWAIVTWTLNSNHTKWTAIDIACSDPKLWLYPWMDWWNRVFDIAKKYDIISLYRIHWVDRPHFDNWDLSPDQVYINNQKQMEDLKKEFGEKIEESLRALISATWKSSDDATFKEKLADLGKYMDSK